MTARVEYENHDFQTAVIYTAACHVCIMAALAQTITVSGTASTAGRPVQNASVTFIDSNNLMGEYSALADANGHYSINLTTSVLENGMQPAGFFLAQNYPNPINRRLH
jgi:hypothetical protein